MNLAPSKKNPLFFVAITVALAAASLIYLKCGAIEVSWKNICDLLLFKSSCIQPEELILREIRLPRLLCALLSGAALAVSGAVLQGILRNPLASPGIIGVSSGGGVAGVIAILFYAGNPHTTCCFTLAGALISAFAVYALAWKNGIDPLRLILAGVAFSSIFGAIGSSLLYLNSEKAGNILAFTIGSLSMRNFDDLAAVLPFAAAGFSGAFWLSRRLDLLMLGDDTARSAGVDVAPVRIALLVSASLLAASAVSIAGLLGFVGLIVPHAVRLGAGAGNRWLIPLSALSGALLVVVCDTAGRVVAAPAEIPAGVMTALIGSPFFLWLLLKKRGEI